MWRTNPPRPWTSRLCLRCSQHQCPSTREPRPPCCSRLPWYLQSTISRCLNDVKWYLQSAISKCLNDIKWYLQSTISKCLNDINALHLMSALYRAMNHITSLHFLTLQSICIFPPPLLISVVNNQLQSTHILRQSINIIWCKVMLCLFHIMWFLKFNPVHCMQCFTFNWIHFRLRPITHWEIFMQGISLIQRASNESHLIRRTYLAFP